MKFLILRPAQETEIIFRYLNKFLLHQGSYGQLTLRQWCFYLPAIYLAICRADSLKNLNLLAYAPSKWCRKNSEVCRKIGLFAA